MKTLYHFQTAARIEAGAHSLNLLGDHLDQTGLNQIRSVFILTQPSIVSLGYADQMKEVLAEKASQVKLTPIYSRSRRNKYRRGFSAFF